MDLLQKYENIDKYQMIIEFFKNMGLYDEIYFEHINEKSKILNLPYDEIKEYIGCFPIIENNKIVDFNIILPKLNTIFDVLIYIHEYSHALDIENENEIFPNLMEAIFLVDYLKDEELISQQLSKVEEELKNNISKKHKIGKKVKLNILK